VNMPAFAAECSLYKSTRSYKAAPNRAAITEGTVVLAQPLMGTLSTVHELKPQPGRRSCYFVAFGPLVCKMCDVYEQRVVCRGNDCSFEWVLVGEENDCSFGGSEI
jgi:hypothetical protein